jgi:predicted O-methyltransferase YrrM
MKYVGDVSRQDATLLERYARGARSVLEFGAGGSTQIIAQALPKGASFLSLDTDPRWIATTRENLRHLGVENRCQLRRYEEWAPDTAQFDLIFDDGVGNLRRDFALRSFPLLTIGGALLFHDTRRQQDIRNVLALIEIFFEEIEHVHLNERADGLSSNITVVRKKSREPYVNWNVAEGRPPWAYGLGVVPEDFWSK